MAKAKTTARYDEAVASLPVELRPTFDNLLKYYKFAALKHHGHPWASPVVLAELVRLGWRLPTHDEDDLKT